MLRDMVSGNQDGDIVFASVLQRQIDKCPARLAGILDPAKDFKDLILAGHLRQTIGAKQDAIPVEETQLQHFNVQLVSLRSHDIRQTVSHPVRGNLFSCDMPCIGQCLSDSVVVSELMKTVAPVQVNTGIADVK